MSDGVDDDAEPEAVTDERAEGADGFDPLDPEDRTDGPPDPGLHPAHSPGVGADVAGLEDIEVDRDVTVGEADPADLSATDTAPVEDASTAALLETLGGEDPVERRRAAVALRDAEPTGAVLTGLARACAADDEELRQFAVEALGEHGTGGGVAESVARDLLSDPDPWVRAEAVVALDHIDRESSVEEIEAAITDEHHAVRRNAAISLYKTRGADALETLLELADDSSARVREWIAELLGDVDDERAREALETLAGDENDVVRETARAALSSGDESSGATGPDAGVAGPGERRGRGARERPSDGDLNTPRDL